MRARHRLAKLLLRHDVRFEGPQRNWSEPHLRWIEQLELEHQPAQITLVDYRGSVAALVHRRDELNRWIEALVPSSPWAKEVGRLRCLRGISTLTAAGLCAEIGDFSRFARAGQLMSYVGLVPSEYSSGESRRLGSIAKAGRVMRAASWSRRPGTIGCDPR